MVFTQLDEHEREAFFNLLDEYFTSRPSLLSGSSSSSNLGLSSNAATSAVKSALAANPEATASLISTGLRHGASQHSAVKNSPFAAAASNPAVSNAVGRVAAASLAFNGSQKPGPLNASPSPPSLPRRGTSNTSSSPTPSSPINPPAQHPPVNHPSTSGVSSLVSKRAFGDVDTTSWTKGVVSLRKSTDNKHKQPPSVAPPIPSAFPKRGNNFAPPPIRRVSSTSPAPPEPEIQSEDESVAQEVVEASEEGVWAEALYDYNSGEVGDLVIRASERIKIVSKDSDDWWTGEIEGRSGLVPATYVKLL